MFENKKNLRAFVVMAVLMVALILNGLFTLGSTRNNPTSAWTSSPSEAYTNGGKVDYFESYVVLEVTTKDADGKDINVTGKDGTGTLLNVWINVGKIYSSVEKNTATIGIWQSSSTSTVDDDKSGLTTNNTKITINKGVNQAKGQNQYSWKMVEVTKNLKYWKVYTKDMLDINEIVITNKDGVRLPAKVVGASHWTSDDNREYLVVEKLEKIEGVTCLNIVDEPNSLKANSSLKKKYNFTTAEADVVNTALSLGNGDGIFVDQNSGVLGLELATLGLAVFGINPLGVRVIPYLFFLLTVCLIFVFARKLFGDSDLGLVATVAYVLLGLGMSVGSLGAVNTIAVFFALLSVYFAYNYYEMISNYVFTKKHTFKSGKTQVLAPILLSAFAFALGFTVDPTTAFALPALVAIAVLSILKAKKIRVYNDGIAEFEDEKVRNASQFKINAIVAPIVMLVALVLFSLLFTVIFYLIVSDVFMSFYGVDGVMKAISAHLKTATWGVEGAKGSIIGWIAGGGSTAIFNSTSGTVYASMNVAVQFVALVSFLCSTVYVVMNFFKKKTAEEKRVFRAIYTPYFVLVAGFIFSWIMFAFVKGAIVTDYLLASVFMTCFIPLGAKIFKTVDAPVCNKQGAMMQSTLMYLIVFVACVIFFGLGYVMFAGIEVGEIASSILFKWWLF